MEPPDAFHYFDSPISYDQFEPYMQTNTPCIFGSWISADWPATQNWVSAGGTPNFQYLRENYGSFQASFTRFNERLQEFDCHQQKISEFIDYWESLPCQPSNQLTTKFPPNESLSSLPHYLKDWHFAKTTDPSSVYRVPDLFSDDWLNRYFSSRVDVSDDYIFSYFGPAGTFTPFHCDVLRSYSWSINLCGKKQWLFLYPGEEARLSTPCTCNVYQEVLEKGLRHVVVEQGPGEGVFVPSGWHHQVLNCTDTISVNHNWANAHCAARMWGYLREELLLVEREIADCRELMEGQEEWREQCQLLLRANVGMGFREFLQFLLVNLKGMTGDGFGDVVGKMGVVLDSSVDVGEIAVSNGKSFLYSVDDVMELIADVLLVF